jgi:hypothetical protein
MGRGFALQGLGVAAHATALRIKPPRLIAISDNRSAETHAVQLARLPNGTPSQCVGIQPRVRRRTAKRLLPAAMRTRNRRAIVRTSHRPAKESPVSLGEVDVAGQGGNRSAVCGRRRALRPDSSVGRNHITERCAVACIHLPGAWLGGPVDCFARVDSGDTDVRLGICYRILDRRSGHHNGGEAGRGI